MKKSKVKIEGKRFSRREITIHQIDDIEIYTEKIDFDETWSKATIERHKQRACVILELEGINIQQYVDDSPHGSALRDYVLNCLGFEPDSRAGLAARIFELCW